jgi:hypothetical protein
MTPVASTEETSLLLTETLLYETLRERERVTLLRR